MKADDLMEYIDTARGELEKIMAISDVLSTVCTSELEENTARTLGMLLLTLARGLQEKLKVLEGYERGERG